MTSVVSRTLTAFLFIVSSLNLSSAVAEEATEVARMVDEDHFLVSIDGNFNSGLYKGLDSFIFADVYFDFRQGRLFGKDQTFGFDLTWSERASLSVAITRNKDFLEVGEINTNQSDLYLGIQDRDRAIEVGAIYNYESRVGSLSFELFKDVTDTHDAHRGVIRLARSIPVPGGFSLKPSIFVNYFSEKYNLYYYGVTADDNTRGILLEYSGPFGPDVNEEDDITPELRTQFEEQINRPAYRPGNSGHFGFDIEVLMPITDNLTITGYFSYEDITGPVFRSPLVEDRKYYRGRLGLGYTF